MHIYNTPPYGHHNNVGMYAVIIMWPSRYIIMWPSRYIIMWPSRYKCELCRYIIRMWPSGYKCELADILLCGLADINVSWQVMWFCC